MKQIVGETLARRLAAWGVDTVFGLPGDGINGLMEGFRRCRDDITFVLVQHEEAAAFMATGYAKATGRLGVCVATSGPGGIHLLNGLYDAKLDHVPVLAITGMQETSVLGTAYQQEVHLDRLFADVAGYNLTVTNPQQMPTVVDLAIRNALSKRTVAHLSFPNDIQVTPIDEDPYRHVAPAHAPATNPGFGPRPLEPHPDGLRRAAEVLNAARKPAMLVGVGALHARAEVIAVAERLSAPIVKTLPGDLADAIAEALAHHGPALVDCDVNPHEPPMPGKVTYEQAKKFTESFLRGQPHKAATLATFARDKISKMTS